MSLPVELRLVDVPEIGLRLKQLPVSEAKVLEQKNLITLDRVDLENGADPLSVLSSNTCKLSFSFDITKTEDFRLELCRFEEEALVLTYRKADRTFVFDRTGLNNQIPALKAAGIYRITIPAEAVTNGVLDVTIYLDTSTFELFVGDGLYTLTARIQPFSGNRRMSLTTEDGMVLIGLSVTALRSIWFGDETPAYLHLSQTESYLFPGSEGELLRVSAPSDTDLSRARWSVSDPAILSLIPTTYGIEIVPLSPGKATVTATLGELSATASYTVLDTAGSSFSSQFSLLKTINGTMEKTDLGYHVTSRGASDAFLISDRQATDFTVSVDILHMPPGGASALVFDWQGEGNFFCVTLDYALGIVKLWGKNNGTPFDSQIANHPLAMGNITMLSVTAIGNRISVTVDRDTIFTVTVKERSGGVLGLNVYNGESYLNRVAYQIPPALSSP